MNDIWSEHGLTQEEFKRICDELGREPNRVELGICGALWSEHCSYKSSRRWLATLPTEGEHVVEGPGENAGIVRLAGDCCIAFKIESHNHPSFIEPYHGAATGVGGILRDVFTMGARPIANLNSLRFGQPDNERTPYLLNGVVRGIADYGNCMGVPTVAGEASFMPCYDNNILVNAMTVGVVSEPGIFRGYASGVGNPVFYVGSSTGMDGIHGATMSSASFDEDVGEQRPAVQVGDPFTEKLLLEACLELMDSGAVVGIQDMGAAGLTSSSFEMASRAESGMNLYLDRVPMRQDGMGPYELMLSESQERMLMVLERGKEQVAHDIFNKWDLNVVEIGEVAEGNSIRCYWHDELAAELPVRLLVDDAPKLDRPHQAAPERLALWDQPDGAAADIGDLAEPLGQLLSHPSLADKSWIYNQYDSTVQANTVIESGSDAAVIWVPDAQKAIAVTVEGNSRMVYLSPRNGAAQIVAEGIRNLACVGAVPLGTTDCLNFGNPERPEYFWEFVEAIGGLAEGLSQMDAPIVGGNVSLYNETTGVGIWPTPTVGFVGRVDVDLDRLPAGNWTTEGLTVVRLGNPPRTIAGSAYQDLVLGNVCGNLPVPDWDELRAIQALMVDAIQAGLVTACHDVAEGGLAVALAEMCLPGGTGLQIDQPPADIAGWFGECGQSIVVATEPGNLQAFLAKAQEHGVAAQSLGTTGGDRLVANGIMDIGIAALRAPWRTAIPSLVKEEV